jgi:hypothetical protein
MKKQWLMASVLFLLTLLGGFFIRDPYVKRLRPLFPDNGALEAGRGPYDRSDTLAP